MHRILLGVLFLSLTTTRALAQSASGAQSTFLDPSLVSSGMGRAGAAVFWGDDPNDWSNPAALGFHEGFRYSYQRTQLVPDLADDVYFTSRRLTVGVGGIGVSVAGKPFDDVGGLRLDYGKSVATDEEGNPVGEFSSLERIRQLAVGVNVLELAGSVMGLVGMEAPGLGRRVDLSLGHAWKSVEVDLVPAFVTMDWRAGRGETKEMDRGALLRVTLTDPVREGDHEGARFKAEAALGFSQRNYDDARISYIDEDQADPVTEERLYGVSARLTTQLPSPRSGWIWDILSPAISWGATYEQARYYDDGKEHGGIPVNRIGQEINLLGLLSLRQGYVDDERGTIHDLTWGIGVGIQYRGALGARFDWAQVPQSDFLDDVERSGFTVFLDPYRAWTALRHD
jgi:hypothetical protein